MLMAVAARAGARVEIYGPGFVLSRRGTEGQTKGQAVRAFEAVSALR